MIDICPHCGKPVEAEVQVKLKRSFAFGASPKPLPINKNQFQSSMPSLDNFALRSFDFSGAVSVPFGRAVLSGLVSLFGTIPIWYGLNYGLYAISGFQFDSWWPPLIMSSFVVPAVWWHQSFFVERPPERTEKSEDIPKPRMQGVYVDISKGTPFGLASKNFEIAGICENDLIAFARYALDDKIAETDLSPRKAGKPFGVKRARHILEKMSEAGLVKYVDQEAPTQGRTATAAGRRVFHRLVNNEYKKAEVEA